MTVTEMREKLREYCRKTYCDECKLLGGGWEEIAMGGCLSINASREEDLARAIAIIENKIETTEVAEDDPVNHPTHYTSGGIECLDALKASMTPIEYAGFLKGQVFKYIWRYRLKGKPVEDLKKARFYLDRLIQITEKEEVVV